ncbi:Ff.00g063290.m01.CDS01 [Fusarium sp. VM40]|nr:Ff.00g063290.m01.CDS01 [Fusarium sp. VM40]
MSESTISPTRSPLLTPTSTDFLDSYPSTPVHTPRRGLLSSTSVDEKLSQLYSMQLDTVAGRKRCPFCPSSRTRTFDPGALQQHLSSGVHAKGYLTLAQKQTDEMSFHCPQALMKGTSTKKPLKHFSTSYVPPNLRLGSVDMLPYLASPKEKDRPSAANQDLYRTGFRTTDYGSLSK